MELAAGQTLQHRGGYRYSNLGGAVAGQLLAIAAGSEYAVLLRERIFAPLQMMSSTVAVKGGTAAWGRTRSGRGRQPWVLDGYAPAGGVISTIEDVARLTAALVDGTAPGIESLRRWTTSRRPRPGVRRACSGSSSRSSRSSAATGSPTARRRRVAPC